jgi:uroporphyrinogen decarboxylase
LPLREPDLRGCHWPEETVTDDDLMQVERFCAENKDRFTVVVVGTSIFERCWALRGFENMLMDFVEHPAFVEALFERLMQLQLDALDRLLPLPMDAIAFGDDFGQQKGLIMSPAHWRKYLKPRLARVFATVRAAGKVLHFHSCGDNSEIMGELIDVGVQIFNPLQPEAMDISEMKRLYGRNVCFEGGIGTQATLYRGSPAQVRKEVARCARILGHGGGYIMTTAKPIRPEVPTENAAACMEAIIEEAHRSPSV